MPQKGQLSKGKTTENFYTARTMYFKKQSDKCLERNYFGFKINRDIKKKKPIPG